MRAFLHRCLSRTPIIGLLMAALLFRALVPAGFMPAQAHSGAIVMQLCSGLSVKSVALDLGAGNATHGSQLFDHEPCGFTVAAIAAPPPAPLLLRTASAHGAPMPRGTPDTVVASSIVRAHSARGPPLA